MWKIKALMNRGYWDKADDMGGGSGAGGTGTGEDSGDQGDDAKSSSDEKSGDEEKKKPSDSEAVLLKEVMKKKEALRKTEEKVADLESKLKQFDGIDVESVRALLNEKKTQETKKLEEKGEWERLKNQIVEEHTKEKQTLAERVAAAEANLSKAASTISELTVGNAFAQSQFIQSELTESWTPAKVRVVYGQHFEFVDGRVIAFDKPAGAAERTPLVDSQGEPLSFEQAMRKIIDADPDRDRMLRSKMKQGAGSKTDSKTAIPDLDSKVELKGIDRISKALAAAAVK
jgi:hypothetical protein